MADPVLDFNTKDRQNVRIDGQAFEMRTANDLPRAKFDRAIRIFARLHELEQKPKITHADDVEMENLLNEGCHIALVNLPPATLRQCGYIHKSKIFATFIVLLGPHLRVPGALRPEASPSSGTNSFPGSSASTAGRRRRGRKTSPSA